MVSPVSGDAAGAEQGVGVAIGEVSVRVSQLSAEGLDVALERRHPYVVLAFDPRHVRAAGSELGRDLLLGDAAAFAELV